MRKLNILIVALLIANASADLHVENRLQTENEASFSILATELERLKEHISKLELILEEKDNVNAKNNLITERENEIECQLQTISSLQNIIQQLKQSGDTNTQVAKAYSSVRDLEIQVEGLKESIRERKHETAYIKLKADEAEKKAKEQASEYEKMEYFVSEQWVHIQQIEQALYIAEEFMFKAEAEVATKAEELAKVYRSWLPPWVGADLQELKILAVSNWMEHAEPLANLLREKASKKLAAAREWTKLHVETLNIVSVILLFSLFGVMLLESYIFSVSKNNSEA